MKETLTENNRLRIAIPVALIWLTATENIYYDYLLQILQTSYWFMYYFDNDIIIIIANTFFLKIQFSNKTWNKFDLQIAFFSYLPNIL